MVGHEQFNRWCYGALAELFTLYSDRTRSFNQWQSVLYPNFKIKEGITFDFLSQYASDGVNHSRLSVTQWKSSIASTSCGGSEFFFVSVS